MIEQIDTTKTNRSMSELDEALAKVAELVENGERLMAVGWNHYGRIRDTASDWLTRVEIDVERLWFARGYGRGENSVGSWVGCGHGCGEMRVIKWLRKNWRTTNVQYIAT